jgi:hypothetical protein
MTISEATEMYQDLSLGDALSSRVAFGKYSGKELRSIPLAYIDWISRNVHPLQNGADVVYHMIFASRIIMQNVHFPDGMTDKQKYTASPADIDAFVDLSTKTPYRAARQEGRWVIRG